MTEVTKRKVSTDALETLGTIIGENEKRDAIHLAVLPVIAGEALEPGQAINAKDGIAMGATDGLGIVDPFLRDGPKYGQRFWMILRPRLVTSLRHVWSHPAFADEVIEPTPATETAEQTASMLAIESIAESCDVDSGADLICAAHAYLDHGEYLSQGGRWEGVSLPDSFWPHFEAVTGRRVSNDERDSFFSCSC